MYPSQGIRTRGREGSKIKAIGGLRGVGGEDPAILSVIRGRTGRKLFKALEARDVLLGEV